MKRKFLSLLLAAVLLCLLCVPAMAADTGLRNFKVVTDYRAGQFTDVAEDAWYASAVATAFRLGLMNGMSKKEFGPEGNLTIAQTVTLAVRLTVHTIPANAPFRTGSRGISPIWTTPPSKG